MGTSLMGADLSSADLTGAHLMGANFHDANLSKADLSGANLTAASLVGAKIGDAVLADCSVYGLSAFNLEGIPKTQSNLVVTPIGESPIAVSDLETAQFAHLLISGGKIPQILESVSSRLVLVLGNFRSERKEVLRSIEAALQERDLTGIVAHFSPPVHRDLTDKILLLARFARIVVADLTESKRLLRFLQDARKKFQSIKLQPLVQPAWLQQNPLDPASLPDSTLAPISYETQEQLQDVLESAIH
jgi:uncharacterized protein YjbI with pentapeptide repeats